MPTARFATSDRTNVAGLVTLVAGRYLELHPLTLGEGAEAVHLDRRVMDKDVRALVSGDEPVALVVVEPLHRARRHARAPLSPCGPPATAPRRRHHSPRERGLLSHVGASRLPPFRGGSTHGG